MKKLSRWAIALLCVTACCLSQAQAQTPNAAHPEYQRVASRGLSENFELRFSSLHFGARTSEGLRPFAYGLKSAGSNSTASPLSFTPLAASATLQVVGSGTLGRLTKWTGFTSSNSFIGDSTIFESKTGLVGIGTDAPTAKLTVAGTIQSLSGGFEFPDGTVQTTSAAGSLFTVSHDATLIGNGTLASPLGVAVPLTLAGATQDPILTVVNIAAFGDGIIATGGDNGELGGAGVRSIGGVGILQGGDGVSARGGVSNFIGGRGVFANGGDSGSSQGGDGMSAFGGDSGNGPGGLGVVAVGGIGRGIGNSGGTGIVARGGQGIDGAGPGLSGIFNGNVEVDGNLNVTGTKNFKIDHPLDPENKYLYHAAVESAEVLNVYSGNARLDPNGEAIVPLPEWFQAINRDFRYTLTPIGTPASGLYIAQEITNNHFKIAGGVAGMKVSWQVTGVRSDQALLKRPFKAEQNKPEQERGTYLNPEAFDLPAERGLEWMRNPELMRQLKAQREPMRQNK